MMQADCYKKHNRRREKPPWLVDTVAIYRKPARHVQYAKPNGYGHHDALLHHVSHVNNVFPSNYNKGECVRLVG